MMFETPDDVLEHFGVKGMKWGVRKVSGGAKRTGRYIRNNPRKATTIAAGALFVTGVLAGTVTGSSPPRMNSQSFIRTAQTGVSPLRGAALNSALRTMIEQGR